MEMNFTDSQIMTMISACTDSARTQRMLAADIDKNPNANEMMASLATDLRDGAQEAETLRAIFATESHSRGGTACDIAHPGQPCPNA